MIPLGIPEKGPGRLPTTSASCNRSARDHCRTARCSGCSPRRSTGARQLRPRWTKPTVFRRWPAARVALAKPAYEVAFDGVVRDSRAANGSNLLAVADEQRHVRIHRDDPTQQAGHGPATGPSEHGPGRSSSRPPAGVSAISCTRTARSARQTGPVSPPGGTGRGGLPLRANATLSDRLGASPGVGHGWIAGFCRRSPFRPRHAGTLGRRNQSGDRAHRGKRPIEEGETNDGTRSSRCWW